MSDILKQVEIAQHIANLISRVRVLERSVKEIQREEELGDADQPQDGGVWENRYIFHAALVSSIVDSETFWAQRAVPDVTSPWVTDPLFAAAPIEVSVPSGINPPNLNQAVAIHFTGTYTLAGSPFVAGRYGLFGGGAGDIQTVLRSVGDDYLVVRSLDVNSVVGTDDIYILKPWTLRRTPFDGQTVNGVTYVYSSNTARVADGSEAQIVTQDYFTGAVIFARPINVSIEVETGIFANMIDSNVDARLWCESEV